MQPVDRPLKAAIIDLNNFSTFPTLAIGLLVAALRKAGVDVEVLCPLAHDVPATERERREHLGDHLARRIHLSTRASFRVIRDLLRDARQLWIRRPHARVLREARRLLAGDTDILLLSAYLQHYPTVYELGRLAEARGTPMLLGGPVFNMQATAEAWRHIPGLTAVVGGEADLIISQLVRVACSGDDLLQFPGVMLPSGRTSPPAPPLRELDRVPVPDFTDFPWDRYRLRVVPVMTGRGCQWNRCVFCSDVVSASGRTFRTRSIESVMHEMEEQARRHDAANFLFLDLKLNSNPAMLRGIVENVQRHVPGAEWIGTVHVDQRPDNGLSRDELRAAVGSGMRRVSFGLESGSQRLLDLMDKGSSVEANARFIRHAHEAGLSVRCTMFKGFPGENAHDLELTASFLSSHAQYIDRVRFNDFSLMQDTPIYRQVENMPADYPYLTVRSWNPRFGRASLVNAQTTSPAYRRAKSRVLAEVYRINRRPLRFAARAFDGLM
jgi:anaerobic magnesium-protoporphyrin IX monomethyl ester cyclase